MKTFPETIAEFTRLVQEFRYEDAHNIFYDEHFVKHENESAPTIGLEIHRKEMEHFLASISSASATPLQTLLGDDVSVIEWRYSFLHKDWGQRDFKQISVQRWKNGRIVHERHHYKTESW